MHKEVVSFRSMESCFRCGSAICGKVRLARKEAPKLKRYEASARSSNAARANSDQPMPNARAASADNGKWVYKIVLPSLVTGSNRFRLGNYYSFISDDIRANNPKIVRQPNQ